MPAGRLVFKNATELRTSSLGPRPRVRRSILWRQPSMDARLEPGDIFLPRATGFLSKAIRFFTRHIGESRTKVNHVGLVVQGGTLDEAVVVEALRTVQRHRLMEEYGGTQDEVAI